MDGDNACNMGDGWGVQRASWYVDWLANWSGRIHSQDGCVIFCVDSGIGAWVFVYKDWALA